MPTVVDYGCSKNPTKRHVVDQHVVDHVVDQLIDHTEKVDHVVDQLIDHTEKVDHVVDQLIDHPDPPRPGMAPVVNRAERHLDSGRVWDRPSMC